MGVKVYFERRSHRIDVFCREQHPSFHAAYVDVVQELG